MKLYHFVNKQLSGVYEIEPGTTLEAVFKETASWPGTRLVLIK